METLILILLGIAGILIHISFKFNDQVTKVPKNGLSVKERFLIVWQSFDFLGSIIYAFFSIIIVIVIVVIRDSLENIFPITELTIIFVGYASDSVFKNLKPEKLQ